MSNEHDHEDNVVVLRSIAKRIQWRDQVEAAADELEELRAEVKRLKGEDND